MFRQIHLSKHSTDESSKHWEILKRQACRQEGDLAGWCRDAGLFVLNQMGHFGQNFFWEGYFRIPGSHFLWLPLSPNSPHSSPHFPLIFMRHYLVNYHDKDCGHPSAHVWWWFGLLPVFSPVPLSLPLRPPLPALTSLLPSNLSRSSSFLPTVHLPLPGCVIY